MNINDKINEIDINVADKKRKISKTEQKRIDKLQKFKEKEDRKRIREEQTQTAKLHKK